MKYGMSPIEQMLYEYRETMEKMTSGNALRCSSCDRLRKGIGFLDSGEFLCLDCLMLRKSEELNNDPECIRKERVYKIREARERYYNGIQRND